MARGVQDIERLVLFARLSRLPYAAGGRAEVGLCCSPAGVVVL